MYLEKENMKKRKIFYASVLALMFCCCEGPDPGPILPKPSPGPGTEDRDSTEVDTVCIERATIVWDAIMRYYWVDHENESPLYAAYPHSESPNYWEKYAAVWGYGSFFSAYNTLYQHTPDYVNFRQLYEEKVWKGLNLYWNENYQIAGEAKPAAYGAYTHGDDRFYDDNVWVGIDLIELYDQTKNERYLNKAKAVWRFIMSGKDDKLGGGIYWKERWGTDERPSKNTCSNAPVAVFGMKLYKTTGDETYRATAAEIYNWTKKNLQDPSDKLYWDNKKVDDGEVEKNKFSYNVGQMLQAAVLLYNSYKEEAGAEHYLNDAREMAQAAYNHYFYDYTTSDGSVIKMLEAGDLWFHSIMFRGFAEFYNAELDMSDEKNAKTYIDAFRSTLNHAWIYARDPQTHLFNMDLSGQKKDETKDLRMGGAMVEMYARMAALN